MAIRQCVDSKNWTVESLRFHDMAAVAEYLKTHLFCQLDSESHTSYSYRIPFHVIKLKNHSFISQTD